MVAQLTSNKAKEDAAIAWVMELERAAGAGHAIPVMLAHLPKSSRRRLIEVKSFGTSNRGHDLLMEVRQIEEALTPHGA